MKREGLCELCNREHTVWYADNDLWNEVQRRDNDGWSFLCPTCFMDRAVVVGVEDYFRVSRGSGRLVLVQHGDRVEGADGMTYEICRVRDRAMSPDSKPALLGRNIRNYIGTRPFVQEHLIPDGPGRWQELPQK